MKLAAAIPLGLCALAVVLGLSVSWLPAPLPVDGPATEFSAGRAGQHVRAMARQPHPAASEENRRVRAYLVKAMSELGLAVRELPGNQLGIDVVNLYAEVAAPAEGTPAILLVSHYDSAYGGPGAADCASGVATLLETVRALRARGPLRNRVAVLFTDGEERGLLGARAFIADHPELWHGLRVVLNLEARGNHGPVMMFETSPGARRLVARLGESCSHPVAFSFSREIYRRLPNDTDFTVFRQAGLAGMNFAFVGGLEYYHTARDTPENLSRRTLQHYGSYLLPLAAALGQAAPADLEGLQDAGEATYFPVWRGVFVHYPQALADVLAWLAPLLFGIAIWRHRRSLRPGRVLAGLGVAVLSLLLAAGLGRLGLAVLARHYGLPGSGPFVVGLPHEQGYAVTLAALAGLLTVGLNGWLLRRLRPEEKLLGALVPWLLLTLAAAWVVPGAAYVFLWPTLLGTLALFLPGNAAPVAGWRTFVRVALIVMPAPMLLAAMFPALHQAVTIGIAPVSLGLIALAACLACAGAVKAPSTVAN